jgi:hypothetical protein
MPNFSVAIRSKRQFIRLAHTGLHLNRLLNVASVLNRFYIETAANDQTVLELEDRDAAHVEGLAVGTVAPPVPLGPTGAAVISRANQPRAEVRDPPEHCVPVRPDLRAGAELPRGVGGLFAVVVAVEQLDDDVQVMRVHRLDELIDYLGHQYLLSRSAARTLEGD